MFSDMLQSTIVQVERVWIWPTNYNAKYTCIIIIKGSNYQHKFDENSAMNCMINATFLYCEFHVCY